MFCKFFLLYRKMSENINLTYYQKNRDVILNRAKDCYKNDKERLKKQARNKQRNLSEEKKLKKRIRKKQISQYVRKKDEKNIKKIITKQKNLNIIINKIVF